MAAVELVYSRPMAERNCNSRGCDTAAKGAVATPPVCVAVSHPL